MTAQQISVDELELNVLVPRGSHADPPAQVFHVTNAGATSARATITIQDWDRDEKGTNRFYDLNALPTSCGARVHVFPTVVQLAPKSSQTVRVTVDSVDKIHDRCYAILFIESPMMPGADKGVGVTYTLRYGVKLYVERDVPLTAQIENAELARNDSAAANGDTAARQVLLAFHNTGGRQTTTHGTLEIRRPDNSLAGKVDIPEFPTLPGATRRLGVPVPRLARGKYVLLALLDYNGTEIAAAQVELDVR